MSIATILTMILVVGCVWGGFVYILLRALSFERKKQHRHEKEIST